MTGRLKHKYINDQKHSLVVFLVNTKDHLGRPRLCTMIVDQHTIDLADGEEFMTAYIPSTMLEAEPPKL